jgi:hypothetical protein
MPTRRVAYCKSSAPHDADRALVIRVRNEAHPFHPIPGSTISWPAQASMSGGGPSEAPRRPSATSAAVSFERARFSFWGVRSRAGAPTVPVRGTRDRPLPWSDRTGGRACVPTTAAVPSTGPLPSLCSGRRLVRAQSRSGRLFVLERVLATLASCGSST